MSAPTGGDGRPPARVPVSLGARSYDVIVGAGALAEIGAAVRGRIGGARAHLVADEAIPPDLIEVVQVSLAEAGYAVGRSSVRASESNKVLATAERIVHELATERHERHEPVVALGGGMIGDVAGFAAAIYRRGVPVVQCPTTLLAMVDASVGGKTGVNLQVGGKLRKNLVGSFWQPALVVADPAALASLPDRALRAGLGECLKHGMISRCPLLGDAADADLFDWTVRSEVRARMHDLDVLAEMVDRNVRIKAAVVGADEREASFGPEGGRALLNLGHTFAHAIEPIPSLSPDGSAQHAPLHHGEAVAYGLIAATAAAEAMGLVDAAAVTQVRVAVERMGLDSRLLHLPDDDELIGAMMHDKKVAGGVLRLVLPDGPGSARIVHDPPRAAVVAGWAQLRRP